MKKLTPRINGPAAAAIESSYSKMAMEPAARASLGKKSKTAIGIGGT